MASLRSARVNKDYDSHYQLGQLSESIHRLLTEKECSVFDRGLADYHRRRNVKTLVECLSLVLNTNQKRKLLIPIRDAYVKPSDLSKFNQLVQAHGLATSHRQRVKAEEKTQAGGIRKLEVKKDADGQWGFSIRGGSEHGIGIFVSWIEPGSNAEKSGLQVGDQILKANDTSLERINHYDAVMLMKSVKKLRLFVLAHGHLPGSRMAHKVYHWVDPEGRPASPPPDPFEIQDSTRGGDHKVMNEADERKVTVIIDKGKELGISIRGGIEHGLGIYISTVEEDSVAESYGLKVGDQILDVNGISFLGIVHADAANALRAQSCMVMKIKDVGKLPHSRITAYSQTKWYQTKEDGQETSKVSPTSVFRPGVGSQMMLGQQQDNLLKGHGLLKDVAQSVLSEQELAMFMYHLKQYQQYDLPINELMPPILNLLDTPEKLQLLTELRGLIKPQDIERFNELTVHKEIMAKKYNTTSPRNETLQEGGRDLIPQKMSPPRTAAHHFNIPPPPTSTPGTQSSHNHEDTWKGNWNSSDISGIHSPQTVDTSLIEERVRSETESRLKNEYLEKEKKIIEEQQRLLEEEQAKKEATLRHEREAMEEEMREREARIKADIESKIKAEIEQQAAKELAEKERAMDEERERWMQEEGEKEEQIQLMQEKMKEELEEKIWKEAEERIREEYEQKRQQEREASLQRKTKVSEKAAAWDVEGRIRRDLENKVRREYEDKLRFELDKLKKQHEKEKQQRDEMIEERRRSAEISKLEAEEQIRIEIEEKVRRETEARIRGEYEARLQHESEERARLAEEVKVRKAAEERLQQQQRKLEEEREKERKKLEEEREQERKRMEEKSERERRKLEEEKERERKKLEEEKERERRKQMEKEQREAKRKQEEERIKREKERQVSDESDEETRSTDGGGFEVADEDQFATGRSDQYSLDQQRHIQLQQEREEEKLKQQELDAAERERKRQEEERLKKKELERKREENLRRREEERKKKELERVKKLQQEQIPSDQVNGEEKVHSLKVKVNFGEEETASLKKKKIKKAKTESIENERRKAEEKLERRLKRAQEKKKNELKSYAGYTDLEGNVLHINVTKVVKKLGIAIDGGANTKQKAVIIREISPEGCAAQTGMGMSVNQQILEVNGQSLFGLKHREVVMTIKNAFDGPMNKVIEFVVLDPPGN